MPVSSTKTIMNEELNNLIDKAPSKMRLYIKEKLHQRDVNSTECSPVHCQGTTTP